MNTFTFHRKTGYLLAYCDNVILRQYIPKERRPKVERKLRAIKNANIQIVINS